MLRLSLGRPAIIHARVLTGSSSVLIAVVPSVNGTLQRAQRVRPLLEQRGAEGGREGAGVRDRARRDRHVADDVHERPVQGRHRLLPPHLHKGKSMCA